MDIWDTMSLELPAQQEIAWFRCTISSVSLVYILEDGRLELIFPSFKQSFKPYSTLSHLPHTYLLIIATYGSPLRVEHV